MPAPICHSDFHIFDSNFGFYSQQAIQGKDSVLLIGEDGPAHRLVSSNGPCLLSRVICIDNLPQFVNLPSVKRSIILLNKAIHFSWEWAINYCLSARSMKINTAKRSFFSASLLAGLVL